jgi:hypothetical protein
MANLQQTAKQKPILSQLPDGSDPNSDTYQMRPTASTKIGEIPSDKKWGQFQSPCFRPTLSSQIQCTRITDIHLAMRDNDD